jgi:hypothetical protein
LYVPGLPVELTFIVQPCGAVTVTVTVLEVGIPLRSPPVKVYVVVVVGETCHIPRPTGTFSGGLIAPPDIVIDQQLVADQFKSDVLPETIEVGVAVKLLITQLLTAVVKFKVKVIVELDEQF